MNGPGNPPPAHDPSGDRLFERRVLLTALLLLLVAFKLGYNPGLGRNSLDGDYYFQIARHVQEGRGLQTSVSLYHQGLKSFPHPTNASPLWPLVLGTSARLLDLKPAAALVPELFYLLDLLLLYLLANRLAERLGGVRGRALLRPGGAVDVGHVAVLWFGLNPVFFEFTSLPYTEALAFFLLLSSLLALDASARRASPGWAAAAGALSGLAFLTRVQTVGLLAAVVLVLGAEQLVRRQWPIRALVAAGAAAAVIAPWVIFLAGWMDPFEPRAMLGVGAYRETPELASFSAVAPAGSPGELLATRVQGLGVAFSPRDPNAYSASHGLAVYLLPLALVVVLAAWRRWRWRLPSPDAALAWAVALAGLAMVAPVHRYRFSFFKEWLFGFRHGLPLILLLVLSLVIVNRSRQRLVRATMLLLLAASLLAGARGVARLIEIDEPSGLVGAEAQLVPWLDRQRPPPVVVTTNAQPLAVFSRAYFHWMDCGEPADRTLALLEHAGAEYVLAYRYQERCSFLRGLEDRLAPVARFEHEWFPVTVLALRPPAAEETGTGEAAAAGNGAPTGE